MKKAKVAISFDDGRLDNVDIFDQCLIPKKIPATLYVTTGYVDGTCPKEKKPTDMPAMTVDDVKRLFLSPLVEIGMHGDMHLNEDWDIRNGRDKLVQWLDLDTSYQFGFASPSTSFSIDQFQRSENPLFTRDIAYLAMGLRNTSFKILRTFSRKVGRVIPSGGLFKTAYNDTAMTNCPDRIIYRVPILRDTSGEQVISLLKSAIHSQKAITLMFHSIGEESLVDSWTWSNDKFEAVCNYLCEERERGTTELCTVKQVFQELDNHL